MSGICIADYGSAEWEYKGSPEHKAWLNREFWKHMASGKAMDHVFRIEPSRGQIKASERIKRAVDNGDPVYVTDFEANELVLEVVAWMNHIKDSNSVEFGKITKLSFDDALAAARRWRQEQS